MIFKSLALGQAVTPATSPIWSMSGAGPSTSTSRMRTGESKRPSREAKKSRRLSPSLWRPDRDVAGVTALAERYDLKIIEDAAHCCPAYYRDDAGSPWKTVGTEAEISSFPFTRIKPHDRGGRNGLHGIPGARRPNADHVAAWHLARRWKRYSAEGSWCYEIIAPGYKYNLATPPCGH